MIAFVGLGNTGDTYANTKHNAGFWVADEWAQRHHLSFEPGKGDYVLAQHKRREVIVVKPTTGMNQSGSAVKDVALLWDLSPSEIYAIVDDVDLPLGTIRIRPKGGDGCHRGMENIIYHLQSDQFPRVRLGIGTNDTTRPADHYVLKPFQPDDESEADAMIKRGADALDTLLTQGLNHTMNHFNA